MDIKAKIEEIIAKVKNDDQFSDEFKANPVKAVEGVLGVDLPDDQITKIVDGVKAKLKLDGANDLLAKGKGLFGK